MPRAFALLPGLLALSLPLLGQNLPEKFRDNRAAWEENLAKGVSAPVRRATEALLAQDGPAVNPSDYNGMHALVAVMSLAARSCVQEGAWEDAVDHLQKASRAASDNVAAAEGTFGRIRQQHEDNLKTWHAEVAKLSQRLADMDTLGGLTSDQIKTRTQIRAQLDEYGNAIASSERSLKEIDALTGQLRKEQEVYAASLAEWQGFLAKEKADIARAGSNAAYVADKLEQVKGDDAKPVPERLAYARRLLRLDPASAGGKRLLNGLLGKDEEPPPPRPAPRKKRKPKPKE
jgi:ABC-type transporter Mla subunit MlaD